MYAAADEFGMWKDTWDEIRERALILKENKACLDHMIALENAGCFESDTSKLSCI